ncbi:hypothetical protein NM688_g5440 [Phlebia brevispora]|uniref:Uncharacterized protein n=1 Tax=Phlebia brevispora TaxID=194682 RepID=A0ACC1SUZ3_9APHY|nr:hypothetical protein NM688_g5440 [Phlebia brevispora]
MGGKAFQNRLPNASFPRLPPSAYQCVKGHLTPLIEQFFAQVSVPREAPEKIDYGDLDFVVCEPREGRSHADLGDALGATERILAVDGVRGICHFAIPVASLDFKDALPSMDGNAFFQVDVQVCTSVQEWECFVGFSSYGDLGMILGNLARSLQLSLGHSGLKMAAPLPTSPPLTLRLSSSYPQILAFFELPVEQWTQGFTTQREIFEWVASSPFFDVRKLSSRDSPAPFAKLKARDIRPMFQNFLEFARMDSSVLLYSSPRYPGHTALDMALEYFGRRALYDFLLRFAEVKKYVKASFTGKQVEQWTGLKGIQVRMVMDEVRRKLGGAELLPVEIDADSNIDPIHVTLAVWENAMFDMPLDELRQLVLDTHDEMSKTGGLEYDWKEAKKQSAARKATKTT